MTEINAITTLIDFVRVRGHDRVEEKIDKACAVLERRLSILRNRAAHNRAVRGKNKP